MVYFQSKQWLLLFKPFSFFSYTVYIFTASFKFQITTRPSVLLHHYYHHLSYWKLFYEKDLWQACGRIKMPIIFSLTTLKEKGHPRNLNIDVIN